jgi:hypothetical protein
MHPKVPVNWCPALGTVLANEEVIDGKSERGSHPVVSAWCVQRVMVACCGRACDTRRAGGGATPCCRAPTLRADATQRG